MFLTKDQESTYTKQSIMPSPPVPGPSEEASGQVERGRCGFLSACLITTPEGIADKDRSVKPTNPQDACELLTN